MLKRRQARKIGPARRLFQCKLGQKRSQREPRVGTEAQGPHREGLGRCPRWCPLIPRSYSEEQFHWGIFTAFIMTRPVHYRSTKPHEGWAASIAKYRELPQRSQDSNLGRIQFCFLKAEHSQSQASLGLNPSLKTN